MEKLIVSSPCFEDGALIPIKYTGPKPPFHWSHIYQFNIYALDRFLDLSSKARKKDLLAAMEGYVLQQGILSGHYR